MNFIEELKKNTCGKLEFDKNLANFTTIKIGGNADVLYIPVNLKDLKNTVKIVAKYGIPLFVIGSGSGILIKDRGFKGVVVKLASSEFRTIKKENDFLITIGAGSSVNDILNFCVKEAFCGIEFLAGIPATLGGLICMNAGGDGRLNRKKQIGKFVYEVIGLNLQGDIEIFRKDNLKFGYRSSNFPNCIIISAKLKLEKGNSEQIRENINRYLNYKQKNQELILPSCGCVFKNPSPNIKAAKLIEECGLKGTKVGHAMVSLKHANFIVNTNNAKAYDVIKLIELIQDKVKAKFGILLEPEIKIIG